MKNKRRQNQTLNEVHEPLAGKEHVERRPDTATLTLGHPESRAHDCYIMRGSGKDTAGSPDHLCQCEDCKFIVSALGEAPDLADAGNMQTAEFQVPALPAFRQGHSAKRGDGDWLEQGDYRLALVRESPGELLLRVREAAEPVRLAHVTLAHDMGGPGERVGWGVTDEHGEARLHLPENAPSAGKGFVVRVLIGE